QQDRDRPARRRWQPAVFAAGQDSAVGRDGRRGAAAVASGCRRGEPRADAALARSGPFPRKGVALMRTKLGGVLVALIAVAVLAALSLFVVDQRQNAIVFRLGEIVDIKTSPGLYLKLPIVDNVRYFDTRILTLDTADPERFITSEKKNVLVDLF